MKEIIDSINKKLTGNPEEDTQFLLTQLEQYRNNKEICDEIYKILFSLLPEDAQNKFIKSVNQEKFEQRMREIQELVVDRQYERALNYLDQAIDKVDKVYEDDKHKYMSFHSTFEAYLYAYDQTDNKKFITASKLDFGVFHKFRGIILNELGRFAEAKEDFLESFKWNPMDFEAIFGYANSLFALGEYEEFLKLNQETIKKAYTNFALANIFHNIGKYYTTKKTKDDDFIAYCLISYSVSFAETEYAYRDLNTICEKYNMTKKLADEKDVRKSLKKINMEPAPDVELVSKLIKIARSFIGKNDKFALDVFKIIYELTHDEITAQYIKAGEQAIRAKSN